MPSSTALRLDSSEIYSNRSTNSLLSLPNDITDSTNIDITDWSFEASKINSEKDIYATTVSSAARSPSHSLHDDKIGTSTLSQQVFQFPINRRNDSISEPVAEWQGQVTGIEDEYFIAQLRGTVGNGIAGSLEEASIPIDDVNPGDIDLLKLGAFFRLCISYEIAPTGNRRRYTEVIFRRLPAYRREELEAARSKAADLARDLRVE
jgi:hypothetical protein